MESSMAIPEAMSGVLSFNPASTPQRKRAPAACSSCHARKVRCNVASSGRPCGNCQQDQVECVLHISARGKHKGPRRPRKAAGGSLGRIGSTQQLPQSTAATPGSLGNISAINSVPGLSQNPQIERASDHPSTEVEDFEANVEGYSNIVAHSPTARGGETHLYVGESQGFRFIFNAIRDHNIAAIAHYIVPSANKARLSPEDHAYLQAHGAFDIETDELRSELIALYFEHAHPMLPVIEPHEFFRQYEVEGPSGVSPLLLQSMFLVASSYLSPEALRRSGTASILSLKKRFYLRAKALYDFEYEAEQTCLIQALLLMGYWYGNTHDRADSWHWIGIAISLSQTLGFHRDPGRSDVSLSHRRRWRRLWWCCFFRDRYVALGMGRPPRINVDDCDVAEVVLDDLVSQSPLLDVSVGAVATIQKCNRLAPVFLRMVQLSRITGDVLASQYRPAPSATSLIGIQPLNLALQTWHSHLGPDYRIEAMDSRSAGLSKSETVTKLFVQMVYHVVVITLFKPFVFKKGLDHHSPDSVDSAVVAWNKCLSSASAAMDILKHLAENDLVAYLPPEAPPALIIMISIIFLDRLWTTGLKKHLATQKIDLAMLILRELGEKYYAGRFIMAYFTAAFQRFPQEVAQSAFRLIPLPGTARDAQPSPGDYDMQQFMTADTSGTMPWWSAERNPADSPSDWMLTSNLFFPDLGLDIFWDNENNPTGVYDETIGAASLATDG